MSRKTDPEVVEMLKRVTDFDDDTIERLATVGRPINIPQNWTVMAEDTPADKAYILLSGEVEVRRHGTTIATLTAGHVIGEMAIVDDRLRNASVVAMTPVKGLHLIDDDLVELLEEDPEFAEKLEAEAASRRG